MWYEPTDVKKATKIFEVKSQWQNVLHFVSPNREELAVIGKYLGIQVPDNKLAMDLEEVKAITEQVAEFVPVVISTLGSQGVLASIWRLREARRSANTEASIINTDAFCRWFGKRWEAIRSTMRTEN